MSPLASVTFSMSTPCVRANKNSSSNGNDFLHMQYMYILYIFYTAVSSL